ncbi:UPF0489 protein C5orf22 homolog isoform X2 [Saccostrea cucullata]
MVFVHFDSHPDLLIAKEMPADDVFNKESLYESISIENWIMPLVYAGHVSVIVWVKPPWCTQIADKNTHFYVGKCATTGTIRCSCKESYFVSETLYRPESQLLNKKRVQLIAFTLKPNGWKEKSNIDKSVENIKQEGKCQSSRKSGSGVCLNNQELVHSDVEEVSREKIDVCKCKHGKSDHIECDDRLNDSEDPNSNNCRVLSDSKTEYTVANNEQEWNAEVKSDISQSEFRDEDADNAVLHCGGSTSSELTVDRFRESLTSISELLQEFSDRPLILDIDLDFYSTKNPFLEVYTPSQYEILKELYSFQAPISMSDEDVEECVMKREKELDHLKQEFLKFTECSEPKLSHSKSEKIKALVDDLQSCQADDNPVNFDLLHEAGCTCDDTELPHHVSSQEEITLLVDATQDFLCHIKRPTIITMARSSQDDYCPPEQVESIQSSVLEVLQDLYLEIELTVDYE